MSLINLLRKKTRKILFTTPSHGQKFFIVNKFRQFYKYDISETDTHNPQTALRAAQERAARIYGTKYTYFLTNGSTSGIIAAVLACAGADTPCPLPQGVRGKVLIWDKAHPSHLNAVKLAGCEPVFYSVDEIDGWGIAGRTDVKEILRVCHSDVGTTEEPLCFQNDIRAVIVTSPTYEGIVSDIPALKKLCEARGAYLIVDEAHGALYPFSERLPQSAVGIADFTIQSLHKTAGGLNPTALLHSNRVDPQAALDMIMTTSPSYPLLASIEANVNFLNSKRGRAKIEELIDNCISLNTDNNVMMFTPFTPFTSDPTKILIKTTRDLYNEFGIEDERDNGICKLFLCGIGTSEKKLERLRRMLKHL